MSNFDFPTSEQKQRSVLMALINGQHLTNQECYRKFGTTELRRIISRLRNQGHNIRSYRREGEVYKHYFLDKSTN